MDQIDRHDWHILNVERRMKVRQLTPVGLTNLWEIGWEDQDGILKFQTISDDMFDSFREGRIELA